MLAVLDIAETARRVRAAMAYGNLGRTAAAEAMHVSVAQVDRFTGKKGANESRRPEWEHLWALADACGLPRDWFSADFDRLGELVPDGFPRFASPAQQRAATEEAAQASEAAAQQLQPTTAPDAAEHGGQPSEERPEPDRRAR